MNSGTADHSVGSRRVDESTAAEIEARLLERHGALSGEELKACCPFHQEERPSFSYNVAKQVFSCHACGARGGWKKLAKQLGIELPQSKLGGPRATAERRIVAVYRYEDETGELLFEKVRYEPKGFAQRRPDGAGGYLYDLLDVRRVLYRTAEVVASELTEIVFLVEGEKDVDVLVDAGLTATCNTEGAGPNKWRPDYSEQLRGRRVRVIPDADAVGRQHAQAVAGALYGIAASVAVVELPGPGMVNGADVTDWLAAGNTARQLIELAQAAEPLERVPLRTVFGTFSRWLHIPDPAPLYVLLGTVAANRMAGDPVWPMFVGPPGSGKTELLASLSKLSDVHHVGTLTEAALLSGTPARDKATDAKGGLLREVGDFGFLVAKDFTTTLHLPRDTRASVLAALREVYDGHWVRRIGSDGGRCLDWRGKVALFAGCTPSIDSHHAVVSSMGERFIFVRLPIPDETTLSLRALDHVDSEQAMRAELADVIARFFATTIIPAVPPALNSDDKRRLVALASLAVRCRSAVERDGYHREIQLIPGAEAPTRLSLILARLMAGMRVVGVSEADVWRVAVKVALDSMPQLRRLVFDQLRKAPGVVDTTTLATSIRYPAQTTRRACEDLAAHGVIERQPGGEGKADRWQLTEWARRQLEASTVPEMSEPGDADDAPQSLYIHSNTVERDFSGKVPEAVSGDGRVSR